jgi:hypothetical protein
MERASHSSRVARPGEQAIADKRQAEFVTDEEQRLLEIEDMRLVVKFGDKKRYSVKSSSPASTSSW